MLENCVKLKKDISTHYVLKSDSLSKKKLLDPKWDYNMLPKLNGMEWFAKEWLLKRKNGSIF